MIEINCICCGAELERPEHGALPVMASMCETCSREVREASALTQQLDASAANPSWIR